MKIYYTPLLCVAGVICFLSFLGWAINYSIKETNREVAICKAHNLVWVSGGKGPDLCVDTNTAVTYLPRILEKK